MTLARRAIGFLAVVLLLPARVAQGAAHGSGTSERLAPMLLQLLDEYDRGGESGMRRYSAARRIHLRESTQGVLIPVILEPRAGISTREIDPQQIEALGGHVDAVSDSFLRVLVPPAEARRLADLSDVRVVRTPTLATEVSGFGSIVSESVALTGAAALQNIRHGYRSQGRGGGPRIRGPLHRDRGRGASCKHDQRRLYRERALNRRLRMVLPSPRSSSTWHPASSSTA